MGQQFYYDQQTVQDPQAARQWTGTDLAAPQGFQQQQDMVAAQDPNMAMEDDQGRSFKVSDHNSW